MYRILPFLAAIDSVLPVNVPVEIWSMILRNLDPASLLSAIRAEPHLKAVAKGDPVLRERIRKQVELQNAQRRAEILNPGLRIQVEREQSGNLFGRNQSKRVHVKAPTRKESLREYLDQPYLQKNNGGKAARKGTSKDNKTYSSRKTIRC